MPMEVRNLQSLLQPKDEREVSKQLIVRADVTAILVCLLVARFKIIFVSF